MLQPVDVCVAVTLPDMLAVRLADPLGVAREEELPVGKSGVAEALPVLTPVRVPGLAVAGEEGVGLRDGLSVERGEGVASRVAVREPENVALPQGLEDCEVSWVALCVTVAVGSVEVLAVGLALLQLLPWAVNEGLDVAHKVNVSVWVEEEHWVEAKEAEAEEQALPLLLAAGAVGVSVPLGQRVALGEVEGVSSKDSVGERVEVPHRVGVGVGGEVAEALAQELAALESVPLPELEAQTEMLLEPEEPPLLLPLTVALATSVCVATLLPETDNVVLAEGERENKGVGLSSEDTLDHCVTVLDKEALAQAVGVGLLSQLCVALPESEGRSVADRQRVAVREGRRETELEAVREGLSVALAVNEDCRDKEAALLGVEAMVEVPDSVGVTEGVEERLPEPVLLGVGEEVRLTVALLQEVSVGLWDCVAAGLRESEGVGVGDRVADPDGEPVSLPLASAIVALLLTLPVRLVEGEREADTVSVGAMAVALRWAVGLARPLRVGESVPLEDWLELLLAQKEGLAGVAVAAGLRVPVKLAVEEGQGDWLAVSEVEWEEEMLPLGVAVSRGENEPREEGLVVASEVRLLFGELEYVPVVDCEALLQ